MIMLNDEKPDDLVFQNEPAFEPGQLVKHKRYPYRGVIVEVDPHCKADESWYQNNQTQPDRNQPWYYVLVHHSSMNTYAAESSLEADDCDDPIEHPMIQYFFSDFVNGKYIRNSTPWPE